MRKSTLAFFLAAFLATGLSAAPVLTITPEKADALLHPGDKIVWQVNVAGDALPAGASATYTLKKGGGRIVNQGSLPLGSSPSTIEGSLSDPGTLLLEVTALIPGSPALHASAGAAVAPAKIPVSAPVPADFDSFWDAELKELALVPENAVLEKGDSGQPNVDYWKITLDNINGTHVQGQLARPSGDKKAPALVIFQYAGVYPLKKSWAVERAAEGWLVLNIMAHDLPIDQPQSFYDQQASGALNDYTAIGNDDREKSYFLRMFLGCHRAVEYISERPDWDGKTLVVTGGSQGGLQSLSAAALDPKVTALLALVPAGCDDTGSLADRKPGWPNWLVNAGAHDPQKVSDTSRYFDGVNFASRIKCPALIGLGLIDTTAPPSGIFAAINQLQGPKEVVVMPVSDHTGKNNSQAPFQSRAAIWRTAFLHREAPPLLPWREN